MLHISPEQRVNNVYQQECRLPSTASPHGGEKCCRMGLKRSVKESLGALRRRWHERLMPAVTCAYGLPTVNGGQ
jgi:hypothetical protein